PAGERLRCAVVSAGASVDTRHQVETDADGGRVASVQLAQAVAGARLADHDRRARLRVHRAQDHAADFSRTWRWVRPSNPDIPRMRSGLTASVSPIVRG